MSETDIHNGGRIAKNTLMLYIRMFVLMLVGLYTSRVVLSALGETDYGIYGVVGGVTALFSVISGTLSAAVTRFITFEMGKGSEGNPSAVFSTAVTIQFILALIIIVLAEPLGIWFIDNRMTIPPERLTAAHWVYQFSLIAFVINIISVPYNASIIAHERMSAFAFIGIFEGLAKLAVAFLVLYSPVDRLIYYAVLMCLVAVGVSFAYTFYCRRNFDECRFRFVWDRLLMRQMFSFAGWNFIGAASGVLRDHGGNILINIFAGPVANAARGISVQLGGAVQSFVTNFMTAVNPQITKSYAADEKDYTLSLVMRSSRFSYYLLALIAFPVILNTDFLLDIWLAEVPARSANFVRLALVLSLSECISYPLVTLMLATGNIRNYQIIVGGLQLLNLPISYLLLKNGTPPESILVVAVVISQLCLFARLVLLKHMTGLPASSFMKGVYLRLIAVSALSFIPSYLLTSVMGQGWLQLVASCLLCVMISSVVIWFAGMHREERDGIISKISTVLKRRSGA